MAQSILARKLGLEADDRIYVVASVALQLCPEYGAQVVADLQRGDGAMCVPADTPEVILLCQATAASTVANLRVRWKREPSPRCACTRAS